jgi:hypothetical protein
MLNRFPLGRWALLVLLGLSATLASGQTPEGELKKPYQIRIVLHIAKHRLLTGFFREQIAREVGDGLQAALGDLARVEVVQDHPRLADVLSRGLDKALDSWQERSEVKTHFVLINFSGVHYDIQARQHDGLTGQPSPVVRYARTDRSFVAKTAALLVETDLGLVGTVVNAPGPDTLNQPNAQVMVKAEMRGGGIGVPLNRWIQREHVFALVQAPPGAGPGRPIHFALLQVQEPPREDSRDGVCTCRYFQRYQSLGIVGLRCIQLGTTRGPLRIRLVQEKPDGKIVPLDTALTVHVRRHSFAGEEASKVVAGTDPSGVVDTTALGERGIFDHLAFVTVYSGTTALAQTPVAIIKDQLAVVPVSVSTDASALYALRLSNWRRNVSDSFRVQINLFKDIEQLAAKAEQRDQLLTRARAGLQRTKEDRAQLLAERDALLLEATRLGGNKPTMTVEEQRLKSLEEGEKELQTFLVKQEQIEQEENDPKKKAWLDQVERGKVLEKNFDLGKALAIYKKVLAEGFESEALRKHVADLEKAWQTVDEKHRDARAFIYNVWPDLDNAGLKTRLPEATEALAVCKRANDLIGPQKLLKATVAHVIRMEQELSGLKPDINIDDEKPAQLIKEVAPGLSKLIRDAKEFLDKAQAPDQP